MHKRGEKVCSTPLKQEFVNSISTSASDIKPCSSDSLPQARVIRRKRPTSKVAARPKKKVQNKKYKRRKRGGKYTKERKCIEEDTSNSEWEFQKDENKRDSVSLPEGLLTTNKDDRCQNDGIVDLFASPERVRNVAFNNDKYFLLSPPLVAPRANVPAIEDKIVDKLDGDVFIPDEDKVESDYISPIFTRSKQVKTYPPAMRLRHRWNSLLVNKGSGDWLVDVRLPTASADLLWEKYVQDNLNKLPPHFRTANVKEDSWDARSDNTDTDTDSVLSILEERRKKLLTSKKLRRMKGSYNKCEKKIALVEDEMVVCVSDDDELPPKSNVHGQKKRKRAWIAREDKFNYTSNGNKEDRDLRKRNGKLMTFNEFNQKSKIKEYENTHCLTKKTSKVRVKSVISLKSFVSKTPNGNFTITSSH